MMAAAATSASGAASASTSGTTKEGKVVPEIIQQVLDAAAESATNPTAAIATLLSIMEGSGKLYSLCPVVQVWQRERPACREWEQKRDV